jgi:hypothetical protein
MAGLPGAFDRYVPGLRKMLEIRGVMTAVASLNKLPI